MRPILTKSCWFPILLFAFATFPMSTARSGEPSKVHKDQTFTEFFRRTSGWTAGDGALSVALSDGRVLWLFGDSHVDDFDAATGTMPCLFQARNAGLVHRKQDLKTAET